MKLTGFLFGLILTCFVNAQNNTATISGSIIDTLINKKLAYTTVSIVHKKDSTLAAFTRADSSGNFSFNNVPPGNYLLSFSYVGYVSGWKPIQVNPGEKIVLGNIPLTNILTAGNVTVTARRPPVTINNDTVEFNAENFKTQPNAVVEDLLKKLPGVSIDKDGTVKVNGQKISRLFVNGKEFFTGDPKIATKNLDADAVDKVQVFDKKSDRAEFTGMDDGQSTKAINLKLKKDRDNAIFGKISAGAGSNERLDAQANINQFKGDKQISFIGMGNNTNKQGFSIMDVMNFTGDLARGMKSGGGINIRIGDDNDNGGLPISGMGPNQQGIATTLAGGINYNNNWQKKTDLNLNGIMSDVNLNTNRLINRQNLLPGNNFNYNANGNEVKHNQQQRINMVIDQKIDSFTSIKITPQFTIQQNDVTNTNQYSTVNSQAALLNEGNSTSSTQSNAFNFNSNILLRHKFKKKGRTLSSTTGLTFNNSKQNGHLETVNRFYAQGLALPDSIIKQINSRDAVTQSAGSNIVYTEPIGKKSLLEFNGFFNSNIGESKRETFDFNNGTNVYDQKNTALTNNFRSAYNYYGGGLSFRTNAKKFAITAGANLQNASLESINKTSSNTVKQSFSDLLPLANVQYKRNSTSTFMFAYNTSTSQPSTFQLQPVTDISDPLNTYTGNPNLMRSYTHSMQLNMSKINLFKQRNLFVFFNYSKINNAIVTSDIIQPNGSRISSPVNANGNYFLTGNIDAGMPLKKIHSKISGGMMSMISRNISFINGAANIIHNYTIAPSAQFVFGIDTIVDISFNAKLNFNTAKYSLQPQLNNHYVQQIYGVELTKTLPGEILWSNDMEYTINTGRSDGFNTNVLLWNAALAKSFLKYKSGELKFSVFDLLNQNIGINRTANQNFIQDTRYNVLQRYFQLSFSYRLNKSGGNAGGIKVVVRGM